MTDRTLTPTQLAEIRRKRERRVRTSQRENVAIGWVREDGTVHPSAPKMPKDWLKER